MPSPARNGLELRLKDVDELIDAHPSGGKNKGRPAAKQGAAITRAGVVLLSAAAEAYVEDLFKEALPLVFPSLSSDESKALLEQTVKRLNNPDVHKVNLLYWNLGFPFVMSDIRWKKRSNESFRKTWDNLVQTRGSIAHGKQPGVQLQSLKNWKIVVQKFGEVFDARVADLVKERTGKRPKW